LVKLTVGTETVVWIFTLLTPSVLRIGFSAKERA
jgi:hypothetical protein